MADFCKQCSQDLFGTDGDFVGIITKTMEGSNDFPPGIDPEDVRAHVLCEGCGFTVVNNKGECVGACIKNHGTIPYDVEF